MVARFLLALFAGIFAFSAFARNPGGHSSPDTGHSKARAEADVRVPPALKCPWNPANDKLKIHFKRGITADQAATLYYSARPRGRGLLPDAPAKTVLISPYHPLWMPPSPKSNEFGTLSGPVDFLWTDHWLGIGKKLSQATTPSEKRRALREAMLEETKPLFGRPREVPRRYTFEGLAQKGVFPIWLKVPRPMENPEDELYAKDLDLYFAHSQTITPEELLPLARRLGDGGDAGVRVMEYLLTTVAGEMDTLYPNPRNPQAMEKAMEASLRDPKKYFAMGAQMQRVLAQDFLQNLGERLCEVQKLGLPIHAVVPELEPEDLRAFSRSLMQLKDSNGTIVPFAIVD